VPLAGRRLVEWSVAALRAAPSVGSIVVACPPGRVGELELERGLGGDGLALVEGGATRSQSVCNALDAVETELVAIHDAARPLLTPELLEEIVATLVADPDADAAIAATPVIDTIKRAAPPPAAGAVRETVDRAELWAAQTPQVFRTEALRRAIDFYPADAPEPTDEAMLVEAAGGRVLIQPAPPDNLKVTTPLDLTVAELLLADRVR
jgi:2-C-methyl-D-erythritol 4-phosphate cytidylyltransferase